LATGAGEPPIPVTGGMKLGKYAASGIGFMIDTQHINIYHMQRSF
jgi:hypothetical protein